MCDTAEHNAVGYLCKTDSGPAFACVDWTFGSKNMISAEEDFNNKTGDNVYFGVGTYGYQSGGDTMKGLGACYRMNVPGVDRDIIA